MADDTWLIQQIQEACIGPLWVSLNSLVIKGTEPVILPGLQEQAALAIDEQLGQETFGAH